MPGIPRSPCEEDKYYNKGGNDHGERSAADRILPTLIILHAQAPVTPLGNAILGVMVPGRSVIA
jgi:hypothetical protein